MYQARLTRLQPPPPLPPSDPAFAVAALRIPPVIVSPSIVLRRPSPPHPRLPWQHYRTTFGKHDFSSFQTKFGWFALLNSEMLILPFLGLNGTTDPKILTPVEAQWGWLETELEQAAGAC